MSETVRGGIVGVTGSVAGKEGDHHSDDLRFGKLPLAGGTSNPGLLRDGFFILPNE